MAAKDLTWKETKILLGNVGALKYFKIWFENQAFTKAKLNSNHFFGTTDKPTAAKKYGLNITDENKNNKKEYKKVIGQLLSLKASAQYKKWGYVPLSKFGETKEHYVLTIEKATRTRNPIDLVIYTDKDEFTKPLFKFEVQWTTKKVRDPSKKTTDTSGKKNNKGKPWEKFYKPTTATWTEIQEKISLKIFQHLIGKKGGLPGVKKGKTGFGDQPPGHANYLKDGFCNKIIEPMWPHIHHPDNYKTKENADGTLEPQTSGSKTEWLGHFKRQYAWVEATTEFPSGKFDVFSYTEFMEFIVGVVQSKPWPTFGKISKKDSWNPADIWLVRGGVTNKDYKNLIATINNQLGPGGKILQINKALINAYHQTPPLVCGISLKQSNPTAGVRFEKVNLKLVKGFTDPDTTPFVRLEKFNFHIPYSNGKYTKKTNEILFETTDGTTKLSTVGRLRIGSNSSTPGNITQDMHGAVGEKAAYGKMPRDLGWKLLMDHGMQTTLNNRGLLQKGIICGIYDFPSYNHPKGKGNRGGIIDKTYTHGGSAVAKPGSKKDKNERTYKDNQEYWEDRVDYITNKSGMPKALYQNESQLTDLLKNLKKLVRNGDPKAKSPNNIISTETNASLQFVELLHLYAVLYKTWGKPRAPTGPGNIQFTDSGMSYFNWVMGKFFYFSQKKGSAFGANFGPFGKLY